MHPGPKNSCVWGHVSLVAMKTQSLFDSLILGQLSRGSLLIGTIFNCTGNKCVNYNNFSIAMLTLNK